jgi:transcriptional regulator
MISKQKREVLIMSTFTNDQVRKIFFQRMKGKTQQVIAEEMGCSDSHISMILKRNRD